MAGESRPAGRDGEEPERILVLRMSSAGDILQTLPAVRQLRLSLPKAWIAWMVDERYRNLVEDQPEVDEVILHPRERWGSGLTAPGSFLSASADVLDFAKGLRGQRFDTALDFQGNLKSGVWSWLSGAARKVAFHPGESKEGNFLFNNVFVRPDPSKGHRIQKYVELLRGIGVFTNKIPMGYNVPGQARTALIEILHKAGLQGRRIALLSPGTSSFGSYKRWAEGKWAALALALQDELDLAPVLLWGPGEEDLAEKISVQSKGRAIVFDHCLSFRHMSALLEGVDLFIGVDSAPMHLAHLLGRPVVAIFGPTNPGLYAPFLCPSEVVRTGLPCSPCRMRGCGDIRCMEDLSLESVMSKVRRLIGRMGQRRLPVPE